MEKQVSKLEIWMSIYLELIKVDANKQTDLIAAKADELTEEVVKRFSE